MIGLVHVVVVHFMGQVFELGEIARELQTHSADRAITLLANNDFSDAEIFGVFVINLVPVDE